ncbi:MAG: hypothetical protein GDA39_08480 [Hyphomonadaceae bacterium]|nr:hypothetical protein [Hyphomonadaceae bacterium]MBC6412891.1 hypothetical protein [Hyphomonadaceae bacterium]
MDMSGVFGVIIFVVALLFVLWICIILPAQMATCRGRSAIGQVLISLISSPVVAIIALLVSGVPYRPDDRDI